MVTSTEFFIAYIWTPSSPLLPLLSHHQFPSFFQAASPLSVGLMRPSLTGYFLKISHQEWWSESTASPRLPCSFFTVVTEPGVSYWFQRETTFKRTLSQFSKPFNRWLYSFIKITASRWWGVDQVHVSLQLHISSESAFVVGLLCQSEVVFNTIPALGSSISYLRFIQEKLLGMKGNSGFSSVRTRAHATDLTQQNWNQICAWSLEIGNSAVVVAGLFLVK